MSIHATVKTITFYNPDNGYSVLKLIDSGTKSVFTATGQFPRLTEGEALLIEGEWTAHPRFGRQFKTHSCEIQAPKTSDAMELYLGGGILKGVGPVQARKLVETFGDNTFFILDNAPERLNEIKGFGPKKRDNLLRQWSAKQSAREVMLFLQSHHISLNLSTRIHKHYGDKAVQLLKQNPYQLAHEMWGIGFLKADDIAQKLGFEQDCYERVKAGLGYALSLSSDEGHVYLTREELIQNTSQLLRIPEELIIYTLDHLVDEEDIRAEENLRYYRPVLFHAERAISTNLIRLRISGCTKIKAENRKRGIRNAQLELTKRYHSEFQFLPEQSASIEAAVNAPVCILSGGPGTGKTTTLLGILEIYKIEGLITRLAAPTGRAAKRMSDVMNASASPIHRLLEYRPDGNGFEYHQDNPLRCDVVIVDEVSMIDTWLMSALVRALTPGTRLLLVGDVDQLPSVGPGKVLSQLIESKRFLQLHLTTIMRQDEASDIILTRTVSTEVKSQPLKPRSPAFTFVIVRVPNWL